MNRAALTYEIFSYLGKFAKLEQSKRGLLLKAFAVLAAARLALSLVPFRHLERVMRWHWRWSNGKINPAAPPVEEIIWAVRAAHRWVPAASCLVQGLATAHLLESAGYTATVTIGTAKTDDGKFASHAWVKCHEKVILGAAGVDLYTPILVWRGHHWCPARQMESDKA